MAHEHDKSCACGVGERNCACGQQEQEHAGNEKWLVLAGGVLLVIAWI